MNVPKVRESTRGKIICPVRLWALCTVETKEKTFFQLLQEAARIQRGPGPGHEDVDCVLELSGAGMWPVAQRHQGRLGWGFPSVHPGHSASTGVRGILGAFSGANLQFWVSSLGHRGRACQGPSLPAVYGTPCSAQSCVNSTQL